MPNAYENGSIRFVWQSNFHLIPLDVESHRCKRHTQTHTKQQQQLLEEKKSNKNASQMIENL